MKKQVFQTLEVVPCLLLAVFVMTRLLQHLQPQPSTDFADILRGHGMPEQAAAEPAGNSTNGS